MKISVSQPCYNEIATALERHGIKLGENSKEILLERNDQLVQPTDWRMATVRKDCLMEAVKLTIPLPLKDRNQSVMEIADLFLEYIMNGKKPKPTIAELETILNNEPDTDVTIRPDGTVKLEKKGEWK